MSYLSHVNHSQKSMANWRKERFPEGLASVLLVFQTKLLKDFLQLRIHERDIVLCRIPEFGVFNFDIIVNKGIPKRGRDLPRDIRMLRFQLIRKTICRFPQDFTVTGNSGFFSSEES